MSKTYTIKPLEWEDYNLESGLKCSIGASFLCDEYFVGAIRWTHNRTLAAGACTSLADGKAQAEAHWQARLAGALQEVKA